MVSQLSVDELVDLLKRETVISEEGISFIVKNEIDGQALLLPETVEHLEELGVGDRAKLRAFISKCWTPAAKNDVNPLSEQPVSNLEKELFFFLLLEGAIRLSNFYLGLWSLNGHVRTCACLAIMAVNTITVLFMNAIILVNA